jgi:hypothetical protein
MSMPYPHDYTIDHAAAAREAAWERRKAALRWAHITVNFLEHLDSALEQEGPLGLLFQMVVDAPFETAEELRGFLATVRPRQVEAIGKAVIRPLAEAQLAELARVDAGDDDRPF